MKKGLWLLLLVPGFLGAFEKLDQRYVVSYGDPNAAITVVEYFSFSCPYCSSLFNTDFPLIKRHFIDTGKAHWIFHPIPVDLLTLAAMACLEELPSDHKVILLEEMLPLTKYEQPQELARFMGRVMDLFGVEVGDLSDLETLESCRAFEAAFFFLKGGGLEVQALPSLEIEGEIIVGEIPTFSFVEQLAAMRGGEK